MDSATWCRTPAAASAARRLRPEISKNSSAALSSNESELPRSITLRGGDGLPEPLAGDAVDTVIGRGGNHLVAALAQNDDGLRANQARAANDHDLHVITLEFGPEMRDPLYRLPETGWQRLPGWA